MAGDICIRFYYDAIIFRNKFRICYRIFYIIRSIWHSIMVETEMNIYKKWNIVIHGFMSHRQMMPVFLLLITIVRQSNKRTAVELNALPSYVNNNIMFYDFRLWISL